MRAQHILDAVRTTWAGLDPKLREELERVVRGGGDDYHSEYLDAVGWFLLLSLTCLFGIVASVINEDHWEEIPEWLSWFARDPLDFPRSLLFSPWRAGLIFLPPLSAYVGLTWIRNHQRRGLALTSEAIVVVRGNKLVVVPYAEIASTTMQRFRTRSQAFTVLELTLEQGKRMSLYTTGRWAAAANERIAKAGGAVTPQR